MRPPPHPSSRMPRPHGWRVRVCLHGAILHLASRTEPLIVMNAGRIANVEMDLISDTEHGDSIGFIDWSAVTAVTWRRA